MSTRRAERKASPLTELARVRARASQSRCQRRRKPESERDVIGYEISRSQLRC